MTRNRSGWFHGLRGGQSLHNGWRLVRLSDGFSKKPKFLVVFVKNMADFMIELVWRVSLADFRMSLFHLLKNNWSHCTACSVTFAFWLKSEDVCRQKHRIWSTYFGRSVLASSWRFQNSKMKYALLGLSSSRCLSTELLLSKIKLDRVSVALPAQK